MEGHTWLHRPLSSACQLTDQLQPSSQTSQSQAQEMMLSQDAAQLNTLYKGLHKPSLADNQEEQGGAGAMQREQNRREGIWSRAWGQEES